MTRKEAERQTHQADTLRALGFTREECESLRRVSMTLQRWFERECGDSNQYGDWSITRGYMGAGPGGSKTFRHDDDGQAFEERHTYSHTAGVKNRTTYTRIADREMGARRRLVAILKARHDRQADTAIETDTFDGTHRPIVSYIQTDPRGAALYLLRPGDVPDDMFTVEEIVINNAPSQYGVYRKGEPRTAGGRLVPRQTYGTPFDNRADAEAFARRETVSSYYTRGICVY